MESFELTKIIDTIIDMQKMKSCRVFKIMVSDFCLVLILCHCLPATCCDQAAALTSLLMHVL